jgi:hypothetical protein
MRAPCGAEVREQCESDWYDMHPRAGETLDRLQFHGRLGPFLRRIKKELEIDREAFIDEQFDEVTESLADSDHEARDPYGYRGLSRKDFI